MINHPSTSAAATSDVVLQLQGAAAADDEEDPKSKLSPANEFSGTTNLEKCDAGEAELSLSPSERYHMRRRRQFHALFAGFGKVFLLLTLLSTSLYLSSVLPADANKLEATAGVLQTVVKSLALVEAHSNNCNQTFI